MSEQTLLTGQVLRTYGDPFAIDWQEAVRIDTSGGVLIEGGRITAVGSAAALRRYLDLTLAHGTTTVASFATIHPHSVDALFGAAEANGQRIVAGKTCMDRNAPDGLRDTAQSAYDDSKALIAKWHAQGRATYAITPRFSPTSTPDQLAALGALWAEHPDCLMQTHLSEQVDEIAWVQDLFPPARRWSIVRPPTPLSDRAYLTWQG